MARVLAISSQVVYGPVGNTAAVPALAAKGHEVLQLPTILLAHHPGHGKPAGRATEAELFAAIVQSLENLGVLSSCAAVMTGYFAHAAQVKVVAALIARMKSENPALIVVVDPVLGDDGSLYVAQAVAHAIKKTIVPMATAVTPNCFELSWLTGQPVTDVTSAIAAAKKLSAPEIIVTSVPDGDSHLATLLLAENRERVVRWPRLVHVPHGTGDFLAGCYLAERLAHEPYQAFPMAMKTLQRAIALSDGSLSLAVAQALRAGRAK